MSNISYEDIFFYIDLTKEILSKKDIIKAITFYIEEKNKVNINGHYGILLFQEEGNPIFITDKKDTGVIVKAIEENWKARPRERSFFENGLFYIFSYIAETVRMKSKYNRVIVVTDQPSDLASEYQEALFNLVSKIKYFPTFIDIIRISEEETRFFKDDVKLNILASDTKGGIFYAQNKKEFNEIITKLVKNKQLVTTFADQSDEILLSQEDYAFYSKLAKNLVRPEKPEDFICYICHEHICPVCTDVNDIPLICEDCKIAFHNCCATNYTIGHHIGIPHIFRCPKCDVLLQIQEDSIVEVSTNNEQISTVKEYLELSKQEDNPQVVEVQDLSENTQKAVSPPAPQKFEYETPHAQQTKIRIGGFFGRVYTVKKVGDKIVYEKASKSLNACEPEDEAGAEQSTPPTFNSAETENKSVPRKSRIIFCPNCGCQIKAGKCSKCGYNG